MVPDLIFKCIWFNSIYEGSLCSKENELQRPDDWHYADLVLSTKPFDFLWGVWWITRNTRRGVTSEGVSNSDGGPLGWFRDWRSQILRAHSMIRHSRPQLTWRVIGNWSAFEFVVRSRDDAEDILFIEHVDHGPSATMKAISRHIDPVFDHFTLALGYSISTDPFFVWKTSMMSTSFFVKEFGEQEASWWIKRNARSW